MAHHDVVVMAASAGGIETLREVFGGLPADLNAAVLVVVHMPPTGGRALPAILGRMTDLPVAAARDGEPLEPGRVYVCVADHHLLVGRGHVHVRRGPRENGHRPAADPLFRSAAGYYGPRVVGVILSGTLSDGTAGLYAVRQQGGTAVVQDPADALYASMPATALEYVGADHVAPARDLGPLIARLVKDGAGPQPAPPNEEMRQEVALMESDDSVLSDHHPGTPSAWPCPDCNGVLWEINDGPLLRFRCRVGHAWSAESLLHEQGEGVEAALWMALRALEDRAALSETLAQRAEEGGRRISATRLRQDVGDMTRSLDILRRLLASGPAGSGPAPDDDISPENDISTGTEDG
jgi:two-component system, chemotaxis family, protein-glutamate methylesterase/glutaminase